MRAEFSSDNWQCPQGWRCVRVGDVVTLQRGFDLPVQNRKQGPFPVIGSNGVVGFHGESKALGPGVVVGRSGTIGKSYYSEGAYWPLNTGLYVKDFHGNEPLFIHFFFQWFDFGPYSAGVSVPTLNRNLVHEAVVSIPPVHEQQAIARVLAKIQAAAEVQEKIVAKLKELKAGTMAKLFREGLRGEPLKQTEIGEIPESWQVVQVQDLFTVQLGKMLSPKSRRGVNPRPYLRNKNVQWGRFDLSEVFQMDFTDAEFERFHLKSGDILVCEGGEPGRTAVWGGEILDCCYQKALHRLRPKNDKRVLRRYYLYWATAAFTIFRSHKPTGTKTTIAHLPKEKLEVMEMALPELSEQGHIVEILDGLDKRLFLAETTASALRSIFSSMLHLLMTGQVRVTRKMIALQALAARTARRPKWSGTVDEKLIQEVVRRIVEAVAPEKIILFGSAARGEMGPDSDLDLLVVKACDSPREVERVIYRRLIGIGIPKDVLVATPGHLEKHRDTIGYIYRPALREGKVIYAG